jgi:hypothetical protein
MAAHQDGPAIRAGEGLPVGAVWTVVGGGVSGLVATYWDDGWHTEIGRDSVFIPPHLLLYGSIGIVGAVLAGWALTVLWRTRSVRAILATPGLALAVAAGVVTAVAAPVVELRAGGTMVEPCWRSVRSGRLGRHRGPAPPELLNEHGAGDRYRSRQLWALIVFMLWHGIFVERSHIKYYLQS